MYFNSNVLKSFGEGQVSSIVFHFFLAYSCCSELDTISFWIILLPNPTVATHLFDTELCFPSEFGFCLCGIAVAGSNITQTTRFNGVRNLETIDFLECLYDIENGIAMTCTEVVDGETFVLLDSLEGTYVSVGEIYNMDIVANACAIRGVLIVAEDT